MISSPGLLGSTAGTWHVRSSPRHRLLPEYLHLKLRKHTWLSVVPQTLSFHSGGRRSKGRERLEANWLEAYDYTIKSHYSQVEPVFYAEQETQKTSFSLTCIQCSCQYLCRQSDYCYAPKDFISSSFWPSPRSISKLFNNANN